MAVAGEILSPSLHKLQDLANRQPWELKFINPYLATSDSLNERALMPDKDAKTLREGLTRFQETAKGDGVDPAESFTAYRILKVMSDGKPVDHIPPDEQAMTPYVMLHLTNNEKRQLGKWLKADPSNRYEQDVSMPFGGQAHVKAGIDDLQVVFSPGSDTDQAKNFYGAVRRMLEPSNYPKEFEEAKAYVLQNDPKAGEIYDPKNKSYNLSEYARVEIWKRVEEMTHVGELKKAFRATVFDDRVGSINLTPGERGPAEKLAQPRAEVDRFFTYCKDHALLADKNAVAGFSADTHLPTLTFSLDGVEVEAQMVAEGDRPNISLSVAGVNQGKGLDEALSVMDTMVTVLADYSGYQLPMSRTRATIPDSVREALRRTRLEQV
ncbi:MAG: hypothetical protein Q7R79_02025, partial [bacterium]|nr:hypothetical protein [bacterium]